MECHDWFIGLLEVSVVPNGLHSRMGSSLSGLLFASALSFLIRQSSISLYKLYMICVCIRRSNVTGRKSARESASDQGFFREMGEITKMRRKIGSQVDTRTASEAANEKVSTKKALLTVGLIFITSLIALFYVYMSFPKLEEEEKQHMKLPHNIEDVKNLGKLLGRYKDLYYFQVLAGVFITYIFLQTFAIPGSIFLSILSGFLFRFSIALLLVCTCSAIGATLCYLLSSLLGRQLLYRYFPEKAKKWTVFVSKHRDNLLNYMLFLRVTPLLPNWFINLASPVIGVPMSPFIIGTFFGVAPPSFVAIQAGQTLHKLTSSSDAWSWNSIIMLCVFALLSLVPVLYKQQLKQKFE